MRVGGNAIPVPLVQEGFVGTRVNESRTFVGGRVFVFAISALVSPSSLRVKRIDSIQLTPWLHGRDILNWLGEGSWSLCPFAIELCANEPVTVGRSSVLTQERGGYGSGSRFMPTCDSTPKRTRTIDASWIRRRPDGPVGCLGLSVGEGADEDGSTIPGRVVEWIAVHAPT